MEHNIDIIIQRQKLQALTKRIVMTLSSIGRTDEQIATALGLSVQTVKEIREAG